MKIFTRLFLALAVAGLGWAPAQAADVTVVVTDNEYTSSAVTISVGLTPYQMGYRCMDDWLLCVDQRLYEAKRQGRNRIA